jgi:tRNA-specific adenosine deaminase 1
MKVVDDKKWHGGYGFRPFAVRTTSRNFKFSRRSAMASEKLATSNISVVWTPTLQETLIGGVLQGRKQLDPRGASQICRRQMWRAAVDVAALCGLAGLEVIAVKGSYSSLKERSDILKERRFVKSEVTAEALSGWVRNCGDDGFQLEDI